MNKKLLSLCAGAILLALSSAPATVLLSEDWSDYAIGSSIASEGKWALGSLGRNGVITVVDDNGTRAAHASFGEGNLPYGRASQPLELGTGLSFEVTLKLKKPAENYIRLGFIDTTLGNAPSNDNIFDVRFSPGRVDLEFGGGAVQIPRSARHAYTPETTPLDRYATYRFDLVPLGEGKFALSLYHGGTQLASAEYTNAAIFSGNQPRLLPFIQFRKAVDGYISNITVSRIQP